MMSLLKSKLFVLNGTLPDFSFSFFSFLIFNSLAPLAAKISEAELTILVTGLRSNVLGTYLVRFVTNCIILLMLIYFLGLNKVTPETMDISSLALKFIIAAVSDATKTIIIPLLAPTLTTEIGV